MLIGKQLGNAVEGAQWYFMSSVSQKTYHHCAHVCATFQLFLNSPTTQELMKRSFCLKRCIEPMVHSMTWKGMDQNWWIPGTQAC
jgi:hypothetical protein